MKNYLFQIVASLNHMISLVIQGFSDFLIFVNSETGCLILRAIDRDRMDHCMTVAEQQGDLCELGILTHINSLVKKAYIKDGFDEEQEAELNVMANILFSEHSWEENRIHTYITNIIKDIDTTIESNNG